MSEDTKQKVKAKINEIKSNIESFVSDINVTDLKASINSMVKDAQKDLNKLIEKDVENVKKKLQKEKDDFEAKAKKFLDGHKKELTTLQAKFDKLVKATSKLKKAKKGPTVAKDAPTSKKKVIKKVAKAVSEKKPGFKTTKKKPTAKTAQA